MLNATSGRYLNNVRVSIEGTTQEAYTNEFGEYRLVGVPSGEARLNVVFTGMTPQTVTVSAPAGQVTERDVTRDSSMSTTLARILTSASRTFSGPARFSCGKTL